MVLTLPLNRFQCSSCYTFSRNRGGYLMLSTSIALELQPLWTVASGDSSTKYRGSAWQSQSQEMRLRDRLKHFPSPSRLRGWKTSP